MTSESSTQLELDIQSSDTEYFPPPQPEKSSKKSLWPIVTLVMLVVAGLFGWQTYSSTRNSPSPIEQAKNLKPLYQYGQSIPKSLPLNAGSLALMEMCASSAINSLSLKQMVR